MKKPEYIYCTKLNCECKGEAIIGLAMKDHEQEIRECKKVIDIFTDQIKALELKIKAYQATDQILKGSISSKVQKIKALEDELSNFKKWHWKDLDTQVKHKDERNKALEDEIANLKQWEDRWSKRSQRQQDKIKALMELLERTDPLIRKYHLRLDERCPCHVCKWLSDFEEIKDGTNR